MDAEKTIAEIELLERIFAVRDPPAAKRKQSRSSNRRHDEMLAHSPWFRLWQRYGICCRSESPVLRPGDGELDLSRRFVISTRKCRPPRL